VLLFSKKITQQRIFKDQITTWIIGASFIHLGLLLERQNFVPLVAVWRSFSNDKIHS